MTPATQTTYGAPACSRAAGVSVTVRPLRARVVGTTCPSRPSISATVLAFTDDGATSRPNSTEGRTVVATPVACSAGEVAATHGPRALDRGLRPGA